MTGARTGEYLARWRALQRAARARPRSSRRNDGSVRGDDRSCQSKWNTMSTLDLSKMPMPSEMPREMIKLLRSVGCQAEFSECGRNLVKFSPIMYGDTAWQHYERWARGARNVIVTVGCYATKYIEDKFVVPPWEDRNQIVREAASIRTHLARMDFSSLTQRVLPDVPGPLLPCPPYEIVEDPRMALTVLMERLRHPPAVSLGYKELNNLHPRTFMCDIVHAWKNACVTIHLIKP